MEFPISRMRRLRRNEPLRALVRETRLEPGALILPLFLCPGESVRRPIDSMPGVFNFSVDEAVKEAESAAGLGIGARGGGDQGRDAGAWVEGHYPLLRDARGRGRRRGPGDDQGGAV